MVYKLMGKGFYIVTGLAGKLLFYATDDEAARIIYQNMMNSVPHSIRCMKRMPKDEIYRLAAE